MLRDSLESVVEHLQHQPERSIRLCVLCCAGSFLSLVFIWSLNRFYGQARDDCEVSQVRSFASSTVFVTGFSLLLLGSWLWGGEGLHRDPQGFGSVASLPPLSSLPSPRHDLC